MPEGHTIHRLALDQQADLAGRVVGASASQARFAAGAARLDGQVLVEAEAWGKHLFHTYEDGDVLHVHLGLIGTWRRRTPTPATAGPDADHLGAAGSPAREGAVPAARDSAVLPEPSATTRLRLAADGVAWDLVGPMRCAVITPDERDEVTEALGPDPLRDDADPERLWARLQRSAKPVGLLLMEQDVVAGIGNVYRSELCNIIGIDPRRPGRKVTRDEFDALWRETVRQLRLGVKRNRIVTMRTEELERPVSRLRRGEGRYVYKQDRCGRCGTELEVFPLAGRTTWRCPRCQPR